MEVVPYILLTHLNCLTEQLCYRDFPHLNDVETDWVAELGTSLRCVRAAALPPQRRTHAATVVVVVRFRAWRGIISTQEFA